MAKTTTAFSHHFRTLSLLQLWPYGRPVCAFLFSHLPSRVCALERTHAVGLELLRQGRRRQSRHRGAPRALHRRLLAAASATPSSGSTPRVRSTTRRSAAPSTSGTSPSTRSSPGPRRDNDGDGQRRLQGVCRVLARDTVAPASECETRHARRWAAFELMDQQLGHGAGGMRSRSTRPPAAVRVGGVWWTCARLTLPRLPGGKHSEHRAHTHVRVYTTSKRTHTDGTHKTIRQKPLNDKRATLVRWCRWMRTLPLAPRCAVSFSFCPAFPHRTARVPRCDGGSRR